MTKLLIVSDSHGRSDLLQRLSLLQPDADLLIHLGDGAEDAARFKSSHTRPAVYSLRGNCDFFFAGSDIREELTFSAEGVKIFACHGHRYGVKRDLTALFLKGLSEGARLILFGHTHEPLLMEKEGLTLLNPGSLSESPDGFYRYAVARIDGDRLEIEPKNFS